jgi:tetratricopeptide (TPR) repeat protein
MVQKESDSYGHSGLASLYLEWSRRPRISVDEATEYLQKAEAVVTDGLKVVSERASLLITSSDIAKELGDQPDRLRRLREAVEADPGNAVGRYLLARAYREQGHPQRAIDVLDPTIKTDFKQVRSYVEYTRAMLDLGEPIAKCAATLSQCRLDGETEPAFIGLYGGLLFLDKKFSDASKLWERAKEQNFTYDERLKRQYEPRDPSDPSKRLRFAGVIENAKPGYAFIRPDEGPVVISSTTKAGQRVLKSRDKVTFDLSFSAKGPFADHVQFGDLS